MRLGTILLCALVLLVPSVSAAMTMKIEGDAIVLAQALRGGLGHPGGEAEQRPAEAALDGCAVLAGHARGEDPAEGHGGTGFYASQMHAAMRCISRSRRQEKKRSRSVYVQNDPPKMFLTPRPVSRSRATA